MFQLDQTNLLLILDTFQIITTTQAASTDNFIAFSISNSESLKNIIKLIRFEIDNIVHYLFYADSNCDIEIMAGIDNGRNYFSGPNINITVSYSFFKYHLKTFYLSVWSLNSRILISHSISLGVNYAVVMCDCPGTYIKVNNLSVFNSSKGAFILNTVDTDPNRLNYLEIINSNISICLGDVTSFLRVFSNSKILISNTTLSNLLTDSGASGVFLVLGSNNLIELNNVVIYNSYSSGVGGFISGLLNSENKLILNNSRFSNFFSFVIGNIFIENFTLVIDQCVFGNFSSQIGGFIFGKECNISINNIEFYYGFTTYEGFISLFYSNMEIKNSLFHSLKGASSILMTAIFSNVKFDAVKIVNCDFEDTLISFSFSIFSGNSLQFLNLSEGIVVRAEENNTKVTFSNCLFANVTIQSYGCLFIYRNNSITITNSSFINISSSSHGTIMNIDNYNLISISGIASQNCTSLGKSMFLIFESQLFLEKSNFFLIRTQFQGGIIYSKGGFYNITQCIFENIVAKTGGLVFSMNSTVLVLNCIIIDFFADQGGTVIDLSISNLIMKDSIVKINVNRNNETSYSSSISIKNFIEQNSSVQIYNLQISLKQTNFQSLFIFSEISSLFVENLVVSENNCQEIITISDCNANFSEFSVIGNNVSVILEAVYDNSGEKSILTVDSSKILNNNITQSFFSILSSYNNTMIKFKNIEIYSNLKFQLSGNLIVLNLIEALFENLTIADNQGASQNEYDSYIFDITQSNFIINILNFRDNSLQLLKSSASFVNLTHVLIQNSCIWILHDIYNSLLFYSFSNIFNNSDLMTSSSIGNKISTIFLAVASNISFIFLNFENIQKEIFFSSDITQYELYIQNCDSFELNGVRFFNDLSYSLYLKTVNFAKINNCSFENENFFSVNKTNFYGGLIFLLDVSNFTLSNSFLKNLGASNSLSPLTIESNEKNLYILLTNTQFLENKAFRGGAISTKGVSFIDIMNCSFYSNKAYFLNNTEYAYSGYGGSIFSSCLIQDICKLNIFSSNFDNNSVEFLGSAIYMDKYHATFENNNFLLDNIAMKYPNKNVSYVSSPSFLNLSYLQVKNEDKYFFSKDNQTNLIITNNKQEIDINFIIFDADNKEYDYDFESFAFFVLTNDEDTLLKIKNSNSVTKRCFLNFTGLIFEGNINTNYSVQLQISGDYNLTKNFIINIRNCSRGEYFDEILNICEDCPEGTFSLVPPGFTGKSICKNCPENAYCKREKIVPSPNFWINSSNFTSKITHCPIEGSCIYQNFENFRKPIRCFEGYKGDLCVVCDNNFSKQNFNNQCFLCSFEKKEIFLYFLRVLFGMALVLYQINSVFSQNSNENKSPSILLKILRDHFNQITLIITFSTIFTLDDSSLSAFQISSEIITYSALNFDCFYDNNFLSDIFFFKIFVIIIYPLMMLVFAGLLFSLFFLYKFFMHKVLYKKNLLKILLASFVVICDTQYPQLVMAFLKLFDCVELDSNNANTFLKFAPHIECYSPLHLEYVYKLGLPCLVIWILGLPLTFFIVLYYKKRKSTLKKMKNPLGNMTSMPQNLGIFETNLSSYEILNFLFFDYKEKRYYWSSVVMIWKSALSILVAFSPLSSIYTSLLVFYSILNFTYFIGKPFKSDSFLSLALVSFICNYISVSLSEIMVKIEELKLTLLILNILIHVTFFIWAFYVLFAKEYDWKTILVKVEALLQKKENNKLIKKILDRIRKITNPPNNSKVKIEITSLNKEKEEILDVTNQKVKDREGDISELNSSERKFIPKNDDEKKQRFEDDVSEIPSEEHLPKAKEIEIYSFRKK